MAKPPLNAGWHGVQTVATRQYTCGFCDSAVASDRGWDSNMGAWVRVCPFCSRPTFFDQGVPTPGPLFGSPVKDVPTDINQIYEEARSCYSIAAYTAAVLLLRKILMNVAVQKGAPEGLRFIEYVQYLSDKNYVPPDGKGWVNHIREKGNEATHEITIMTKENAEDLITFAEMLLKFIYEFPSKVRPPGSPRTP